eukprot:194806-Rhodomonas_salina.3
MIVVPNSHHTHRNQATKRCISTGVEHTLMSCRFIVSGWNHSTTSETTVVAEEIEATEIAYASYEGIRPG